MYVSSAPNVVVHIAKSYKAPALCGAWYTGQYWFWGNREFTSILRNDRLCFECLVKDKAALN